jgi:hypothetical protein
MYTVYDLRKQKAHGRIPMNCRKLFHKVAEALTIEVVLADPHIRESYLAIVREKWSNLSKLEELLSKLARQKFFRQNVWDGIEIYLTSVVPRGTDLPNLFDQPAAMYFEVVEGEEYGLTSSTIGEINKHVVPRLLTRIREKLAESEDLDTIDVLTNVIATELGAVVCDIYAFRRQITDRLSVKMF